MIIKTISGRRNARRAFFGTAAVVVLAYILAPIYWIVSSSFQSEAALQKRPPNLVPTLDAMTLDHYAFIMTGNVPEGSSILQQGIYTMQGTQVYPAVLNSLIVALATTIVTVALAFPAAHVFARYRFPGNRQLMIAMLATRLMPSISLVAAMFVLFRTLGLLDSKLGLILVYVGLTTPFAIWVLRAYLRNIPVEFEEAARLDGSPYFRTLLRVVFPLARPGFYAVAILTFMTAYGEFVLASILTQTINSQTQTVVLASLAQGLSISRGMMAAAAVSAMALPLVVALVFRKAIIDGLTARLGL